jgi:hypothetical protein
MEMREVLRVLTARLQLAPDRPPPERMRRRGVTLQPGRGARVVLVEPRRAHPRMALAPAR